MNGSNVILAGMLCILMAVPSVWAAPPADACPLLTQAQVGSALGVPVDAGSHITPNAKRCVWFQAKSAGGEADPSLYTSTNLMLTFETVDEYKNAKMMMEGSHAMAKNSDGGKGKPFTTPVSGLGDDAYYAKVGTLTNLCVARKDVAFCIEVHGNFPDERRMSLEKTVALQILPKL